MLAPSLALVILLILSASLCLFFAVFAFTRSGKPGSQTFTLLTLACAIWCLGYALEIYNDNLSAKLFWVSVQYLGIATVPTMWLAFAAEYASYEPFLKKRNRNIGLLLIIPAITVGLIFTNRYHNLIWEEFQLVEFPQFSLIEVISYGSWFNVNAAYSYILLLIGSIMLVRKLFRGRRTTYTWQIIFIVLGVLVPWASNALYLTGLSPFGLIDPSPFAFTLTAFFLALGVFWFGLLDVVPIARQAVLDRLESAVVVLDPELRIVELNPAARQMLNIQNKGYFGQAAGELLNNYPQLLQALKQDEPRQMQVALEIQSDSRTTEMREYDFSYSYVYSAKDNETRIGSIMVFHDITELRRTARQLEYANEKLEANVQARTAELASVNQELELERHSLAKRVDDRTLELANVNNQLQSALLAKDQFLANMGHELRTPLNAILGMSESLDADIYGTLTNEQRNSVNLIYQSGSALLDLINVILDITRSDTRELEIYPDEFIVDGICKAALQVISEPAKEKSIRVKYSPAPEITSIYADEQRLRQMLLILLNNAVKFTPVNGRIGLKTSLNRNTSEIHFMVGDTGPGIPFEDQKRLFQPFVQLDAGLDRKHDGSGLGLALVKRLAELHQGRVTLQSVPGKGSQFTITLPARYDTTIGTGPMDTTNSLIHTTRPISNPVSTGHTK